MRLETQTPGKVHDKTLLQARRRPHLEDGLNWRMWIFSEILEKGRRWGGQGSINYRCQRQSVEVECTRDWTPEETLEEGESLQEPVVSLRKQIGTVVLWRIYGNAISFLSSLRDGHFVYVI